MMSSLLGVLQRPWGSVGELHKMSARGILPIIGPLLGAAGSVAAPVVGALGSAASALPVVGNALGGLLGYGPMSGTGLSGVLGGLSGYGSGPLSGLGTALGNGIGTVLGMPGRVLGGLPEVTGVGQGVPNTSYAGDGYVGGLFDDKPGGLLGRMGQGGGLLGAADSILTTPLGLLGGLARGTAGPTLKGHVNDIFGNDLVISGMDALERLYGPGGSKSAAVSEAPNDNAPAHIYNITPSESGGNLGGGAPPGPAGVELAPVDPQYVYDPVRDAPLVHGMSPFGAEPGDLGELVNVMDPRTLALGPHAVR